jgi:hypothetical protein
VDILGAGLTNQEVDHLSKLVFAVAAVLIGLVLNIQAYCATSTPPNSLDAETKRQVLVEVADVIRDYYADPEIGRAIADTIMSRVEQIGAGSAITVKQLIAEVMSIIRPVLADRHFNFSDRLASKDDSNRPNRSKHGLRTVRMLAGQTAYFEFDGFPGDDTSLKAVAEAIEEQPEMRAVIFDLRDNNGGAGDMVVQLCNQMLEPDLLLYTYTSRSAEAPTEVRSSACTQHIGSSIPVYILTSANTLSAAEAFTYILQNLGRAVVIGERTAGMVNPSRTYTIAGRFDLTVPFLLMRYGPSGGTYAGTGVQPDIEVSAESALETALKKLQRDG